MLRTLLLSSLVSLLAAASSASAQDAETLVRRGVELRRAGDDEAALTQFRAASRIDPNGRVLGQMGFAEQALGMWVDAATHLRAALGTRHEWVEAHRAAIAEQLRTVMSHLGRLDVRGGQNGAEVFVDGVARGTLPLAVPLLVPPGSVTLTVRASGFQDLERNVSIAAGRLTRESITLRPAVSTATGVAESEPVEATAATTTDAPSEGGGADMTLTIVGSILAGLGVVSAAVLGGVGLSMREENALLFNDDGRCHVIFGVTRGDQCPDELDAVRTGEALAGVGFAVGGAMAVAGAILIAVGASSGSGDSAGVRCGDGPGDIGLACGGTF